MKIGLLFPFRNPPYAGVSFPDFYTQQLELTQIAENLGYDEIWLSEHHFSEDGYSPALMPIAGAVAAVTSKIRIGTYLILLPLHNALQLAEDAATVDILSNGRFDLGIGMGYSKDEFEGYGVPLNERVSRLREGVEVIKGAWTTDNFCYEGKHYNLKNVNLSPRPVQDPMPIWIGASVTKAAERVAKLDCHFLGGYAKKAQRDYDNALREQGKNPDNYNSAGLRWCYVAETREQAWDDCQKHLHYMMTLYHKWAKENFPEGSIPELPEPEGMRDFDMRKLNGMPMIGTPDDVYQQISEQMGFMRMTDLVLGMCLPGLPQEKIKSSLELFAKEVMPRLK